MNVEKHVLDNESIIFNASLMLSRARTLLHSLKLDKLEEMQIMLKESIIIPINSLKADAIKLTNARQLLIVTHKLALFYKLWNMISSTIGKNFVILNMVDTAQQIRNFESVIDWEELSGLAEVDQKKQLMQNYKEKLLLTTDQKFEEAFNMRDEATLSKCLQVYFLLEKLHENVQKIINVPLKQLLKLWKEYVVSLGPLYKEATTKDEETFIEKFEEGLFSYTSEMQKCSSKIETLCRLLSNKDQVSQESFESALAKGGLANLFDKYWDSQATIIEKSIRSFKESLDQTQERVYNAFIVRYPLFASRLILVWSRLIHDGSYFDVEYHIGLKTRLLNSIAPLKKDYVDQFKANLDKYVTDIKDGFTSLEKSSSGNVYAYQSQKISKNLSQLSNYILYYYYDSKDAETISTEVLNHINSSLLVIMACIETASKSDLLELSRAFLYKQLSSACIKDEPFMVPILSKLRPTALPIIPIQK